MATKKDGATKSTSSKKATTKRTTKKTTPAPAAPGKPLKERSKKAAPAKPEAKPAKSAPTRKNAKHADVPDSVVLTALASGKPSTKKELVAACGGDEVAVAKTIQRLRGLGQIVASGTSRSMVYSKAA
jgi:hypothetical protein